RLDSAEAPPSSPSTENVSWSSLGRFSRVQEVPDFIRLNTSYLFGTPGSRPTWTSSAKDIVTTGLGTSRVWVTLGYGILTYVYVPATGQPQIPDLGFIVAGPSGWFEVKRVNRYQISMPDDWMPLPQVTHQGDCYRLVIEVVPDPRRDVVLISYRLTGDDVTLYALLAPHLSNSGEHNNARA